MEKNYITIKEACDTYNKSLSTIRRIVKEAPKNAVKKEKLKTGYDKVFLSTEYLDKYFKNSSTQAQNSNSSNDGFTNSLNDTIEFLKAQLIEKDKQIESFLQRQYENNVIIERMQQKEQNLIEETNKKKRWWQSK